jgi:hypothetical protein
VIYCSACVLQSILHQDWSSDSAKGILIWLQKSTHILWGRHNQYLPCGEAYQP